MHINITGHLPAALVAKNPDAFDETSRHFPDVL